MTQTKIDPRRISLQTNDPFGLVSNVVDVFSAVANQKHSNYPPCNAWKTKNGDVVVQLAVAGFTRESLLVEFDGQELVITGKPVDEADDVQEYLLRNLSLREFRRAFTVKGQYVLESATVEQGLMKVVLKSSVTKQVITFTE